MTLSKLIDRFRSHPRSHRRQDLGLSDRRRRRLRGQARRLAILETLEDRRLLATLVVTSTSDSGAGSLRSAIESANANTGPDTITFADSIGGTINLAGANGALQITDSVSIIGPGSEQLTLRAATNINTEFRILEIAEAAGDVSIEGLTLTGGRILDDGGGAIDFASDGALTIRESVISGNRASNGGGVYVRYAGSLNIVSSTISGNTAQFGTGGGIQSTDGDITLTSSVVSDNDSYGSGGGISSAYGGSIEITDSEITLNRVTEAGYNGGGLYSGEGPVTISGSTISGNTSPGEGGGLYSADGKVVITRTDFRDNDAFYGGGAIFNDTGSLSIESSNIVNNRALYGDGGGIANSIGALTLTKTTISGNRAVIDGGGIATGTGQVHIRQSLLDNNTAGGSGGAIATRAGAVTLSNSTLSNNETNLRGGGIFSVDAPVRLVNSTLTLNQAILEAGGLGFVVDDKGESALIHNSIIAGNAAPSVPDLVGPSNLQVASSLIGSNSGTSLAPSATPDANGNLIGTSGSPMDARLQPLSENGGPTQTHALFGSSPAVNAGNDSLAIDFGSDGAPGGGDDTTLTSDQRSGLYQRFAIAGGTVDMGAYESQPRPLLTVDTNDDVVNGDYSPGDRSLRELLELANESPGNDTILFSSSLQPIELNSALGSLRITDTVRIAGPRADLLTIQSDPAEPIRLIEISSTAGDVTVAGVTLRGGAAGNGDGGAILHHSSGNLLISSAALHENSASSGGAVALTDGTLSVASTTLAGNSATENGGAIALTDSAVSLLMVNATVSGNLAVGDGGGVYSSDGRVNILNSTLTLNDAQGDGGGIGLLADNNGESLDLTNTIVAGNTAAAANDFVPPLNPANLDVRSSIVGDNTGTTLTESTYTDGSPDPDSDGNLIGGSVQGILDPLLGPLADNGGATATHHPLDSSPALEAGNQFLLPADSFDVDSDGNRSEFLPIDQRGADRITGALDIGAVEAAALPEVNWSDPAAITVGTALSATELNATSPTLGTFEYTPGSGTILPAGEDQPLNARFVPNNPLDFRPTDLTVLIDVLRADPVVTWETPESIPFGTPLGAEQLNATTDQSGSLTYDPSIGTVLDAGSHVLSVTFTPDDILNYNEVIATVSLTVDKVDPIISWATPQAIVFGQPLGAQQLNATADVDGAFSYDPDSGTVLSAGIGQTLSVVFTPTDATNYNSIEAQVSIDVAKADPVITWADPADIAFGTPLDATQLNASADVAGAFEYTPPAGVVLGAGSGQTLSATFTPDDTANYNNSIATVSINVTQAVDFGDAPAPYPVLLADDGPRHAIGSLRLGDAVDGETDGQPSENADADGADDGITLIATPVASSGSNTTASFLVNASAFGRLDAWIDLNLDGDWGDAGEQIATSLEVFAGNTILTYTVPSGAPSGDTAARFRLSSSGGLSTTGEAMDGEVEDYIVALLDGDLSAEPVVVLPNTVAFVQLRNGDLVVRDENVDLFAAPVDELGRMSLNGTDGDDSISLDIAEVPTPGIRIDGAGGWNTLVIGSADVDFTDTSSVDAHNLRVVDTTSSSHNMLAIDAAAIQRLAPADATIRVLAGTGDSIRFGEASDWAMVAPLVDNGRFVLVAENQQSGEVVELDTPRAWQNPIVPSDVNNNGEITAGDALLIINELGRRRYSDAETQLLGDPLSVDPWPGSYYDQSGDGHVTSLDALRIINEMARISNSGGDGESEQDLGSLNLGSLSDDRVQDDATTAAPSQTLDASPRKQASLGWTASLPTRADWKPVDSEVRRSDDEGSESTWADRVDEWLSHELSL